MYKAKQNFAYHGKTYYVGDDVDGLAKEQFESLLSHKLIAKAKKADDTVQAD